MDGGVGSMVEWLVILPLIVRKGVFEGIASIIRESCNGYATVTRARRGDLEPDRQRTTVPWLSTTRSRAGGG